MILTLSLHKVDLKGDTLDGKVCIHRIIFWFFFVILFRHGAVFLDTTDWKIGLDCIGWGAGSVLLPLAF